MTRLSGFRGRLHTPGPLYWAQMLIPDPAVASILGSCGYDYVMVDVEHGPFTLTSLRACIEALKATSAAIVCRTASDTDVEIKQILDLGADGVLVPHVESAEQMEAIVRAVRYAPEGIRSVSRAVRAMGFGLDDEGYLARANSSIAAMAVIESRLGVENADEIVSVPGLDAVVVGGDDLSTDMGLTGQHADPRLREAIEHVVRCAVGAGLKVGARRPTSRSELDSTLVGCFNDVMAMSMGARRALTTTREAMNDL